MNKLLKDICRRLPYELTGKLDSEVTGKLIGISLKNPDLPVVEVSVPGFKSSWTCSLDFFRPILKRMEEGISQEKAIEEGYDVDGLIDLGLAIEWKP